MRVTIVTGGTISLSPLVQNCLRKSDYIIAADLGFESCIQLGFKPDALVGDLDSLSKEMIQEAKSLGICIHEFSCEKDETDTELAISLALKKHPSKIYLLGALGGKRTDHLLGNIFLLLRFKSHFLNILDGDQIIFCLSENNTLSIQGKIGDLLSLLPINGDAEKIKASGLRYPLDSLTLFYGSSRGVSNIFTENQIELYLEKGKLLVVHTVI